MPRLTEQQRLARLEKKIKLALKDNAWQQRMSSVPNSQIWETAKTAYQEGNFSRAIAELEKIGDEMNTEQRYYLAQSYIATEKFADAIKHLEKLANLDHLWNAETRWLLALVYVKDQQIEKAKPILATFAQKGWRSKAAQDILDELK
jgi:outer membrane protein assembly factor BamD (BamD/ComL family)